MAAVCPVHVHLMPYKHLPNSPAHAHWFKLYCCLCTAIITNSSVYVCFSGRLRHKPLLPIKLWSWFYHDPMSVHVCVLFRDFWLPCLVWSLASCSMENLYRQREKEIKDRMSFTAISLIDYIDIFNPPLLSHFHPLPFFLIPISSSFPSV